MAKARRTIEEIQKAQAAADAIVASRLDPSKQPDAWDRLGVAGKSQARRIVVGHLRELGEACAVDIHLRDRYRNTPRKLLYDRLQKYPPKDALQLCVVVAVLREQEDAGILLHFDRNGLSTWTLKPEPPTATS